VRRKVLCAVEDCAQELRRRDQVEGTGQPTYQ
jgi:hypothetical protein